MDVREKLPVQAQANGQKRITKESSGPRETIPHLYFSPYTVGQFELAEKNKGRNRTRVADHLLAAEPNSRASRQFGIDQGPRR